MMVREWVASTQGQSWQYYFSEDHLCPFLWHYHPEFELTFTQNARGMRYIGGDVADFGEIDLALVAPNQPHTWQALPSSNGELQTVQVAFFTMEWLHSLAAAGASELVPLCQWLTQIQQGAIFSRAMAAKLKTYFEELHQLRGLPRLLCLLHILNQLRQDQDVRYLQGHQATTQQDKRLAIALDYLQSHYAQSVTLEDLAKKAHTSSATIKRLFAEQMQTSFSELLAQLRVGHACNMLLTSSLPIPAIAQKSGFPSLSHFYRKFTELKSMPPAQFRTQFT